jgi:membrane-associated protease RseP (regulator of RpoE activity)
MCLFMMLTVTGAPGGHIFIANQGWQINEVLPETAASAAGLQPGDRIESIDGQHVGTFTELRDLVFARPGKTVAMVVSRAGQNIDVTATIGTESGHGKLGVQSGLPPRERVNPITATGRSVAEFGTGVKESFSALGSFFSPSGLSGFASDLANRGSPTVTSNDQGTPSTNSQQSEVKDRPVSIVGAAVLGSDLTREGLYAFLAFFATINLFIGIVNLFPLLPLDGGHVAIATYERIRSRRGRRYHVDVVKLLPLTYAVVMVLGLLFVSTLYLDLVDPIRLN